MEKGEFGKAGLNYHYLESAILDNPVNQNTFNPVSFELGICVKYSRFAVGLRIDPVRWESSVDFGIPIYKKYKPIRN